MDLPNLIAAADTDTGITPLYLLGYIATFAVGAAVAWFGQSLRSSAQLQERLDETAEAVVQEKFDSLSNGLETRIDGHESRLDHIEGMLEKLGEDRHKHEMRIASEISALRVLIARETATKEQMSELSTLVSKLSERVAEIAAAIRRSEKP